MATPRILITRALPQQVVDAVAAFAEVSVNRDMSAYRSDDAAMAMISYDGIMPTLGDNFGPTAFRSALDIRCKIIANVGVGYNHIDVAAAHRRGVVVTNTPGAVTDATADVAMMLLLSVARRGAEGDRLIRAGNWNEWHPMFMLGTHVTGKRLGIIGMGGIGRALAKRAHFGFDMEILYYNRSTVDCGIPGARQVATLEEVMAGSDFVSVHLPGGDATRHIMNAEILSHARRGAILINTARGDVVDEAALIAALKSGQLAGAGLDVFESEPHVPEALRAMENVVLTPHTGTSSLEVRLAMMMMAVENLRAFFAGEPVPNPV